MLVRSLKALLRLKVPLLAAIIIDILVLFYPINSYAEQQVDLYLASGLVVNQTAAVRKTAVSDALASVIVRLSGNKQALQNPLVQDALRNSSAYLYEFSYQTTDKTLTIAGAEVPATRLLMRFAPTPLEQLLRDAQLPFWPANRPDVLLWVGIDSDQIKQSYASNRSFMSQALLSAADNRGLPIINPVLDLEDRSALPIARLWALDEGAIRVASRRYSTDAVMAGRFTKESSRWTGSFILLHQGKVNYFSAKGRTQRAIAASVIDQLSDHFSAIYAVSDSVVDNHQKDFVSIQINNVDDFAIYAKALTYLEQLTVIKSLHLARVDKQQLRFQIALNGTLEQFMTTLDLDKKLRRVSTEASVPVLTPLSVSLGEENPVVAESLPVQQKPIEFVWQ